MNLSGKWIFKEDFSFGKDEGKAELEQVGHKLFGTLEFTETIEEEAPFKVRCKLEGTIDDNNVVLNVVEFKIIESSEPIDYYPEKREGMINSNGQIVGSSEDEQGVCGVFVMERV